MDVVSITEYIESTFADIHIVTAWGETSFFYNPNRNLPRGIYFATIKEKNGPNDRASNLDRSDVFRLNIGISKLTYRSLFGQQPSRPQAGGVIDTGHDFAALDQLLPHPVYGWMSWVAVLNPSATTFEDVKPLLSEAYRGGRAKLNTAISGKAAPLGEDRARVLRSTEDEQTTPPEPLTGIQGQGGH